jgi:large subunit ribosomal protein L31
MKKDIHPKYYPEGEVRCSCGHVFKVGSTKESVEIEICSQCHPFYTGREKTIDKAGQIQKFKERLARKRQA